MKQILGLLGTWVLVPGTLLAQAPAPPALPAEARQFDFWIGEWEVTTPDGKPAGRNRIELVAGQAALLETWEGAGGYSGRSLNAYDSASKQWQQYWVGSDGAVLVLAGGYSEGRMVLLGRHEVGGRSRAERITWSPNPDGSVRQHWEQSVDDGRTWSTVFDGRYRRRG